MSASFAYMSQSKLRIKGALLILDDTLIYTFKRKCLQNTRKKKKKETILYYHVDMVINAQVIIMENVSN